MISDKYARYSSFTAKDGCASHPGASNNRVGAGLPEFGLTTHRFTLPLLKAECAIFVPSGDQDGFWAKLAEKVRRTTLEPSAFIT